MNRGARVEATVVRRGNELPATEWDDAVAHVATLVRGAGPRAVALVSAKASTEALFLARELFRGHDWTGAFQVVMGEEAPLAGVPGLALPADPAPHANGAQLLGYGRAV